MPIHRAAYDGQLECVKVLLDAGAMVSAQNVRRERNVWVKRRLHEWKEDGKVWEWELKDWDLNMKIDS